MNTIYKLVFILLAGVTHIPVMTMKASAQSDSTVIIPAPLAPGDKIAILAPASSVKTEYIDSAAAVLARHGYVPEVSPYAYGSAYGSYAANDETRAADLMKAFADTTVKAILCARGGYGTVRLLPMLDKQVVRDNPKWLIGYSDISDLHAFMHHSGVASVHAPMASHLAIESDTLPATELWYRVLSGDFPLTYTLPWHRYNKPGKATGRLVGGNLLTINGLAETEYDVLNPADGDEILFLEDVGEKIYALERVLMRLHYSGALKKFKGLVIGQFTEYGESKDFETPEQMIFYWLNQWGYYNADSDIPIVFDFPVGHVSDNFPMIVSAETELNVTPDGTTFTFTGY